MAREIIFGLVGGLGLFLFGIKSLSEGLQKAAGSKIRQILKFLTKNALIGILVGTAVTALIQSSSATTVMVVGFVNATLMTLRQALGVIMGANIGTTVTAQIIAFKLDQYALPAIGIGFAFMAFGKRRNWRFWGQVLFGFGFLFLGMTIMKDTLKPLAGTEHVRNFFIVFSRYPILGVLAGMLVTFVVQSSSATIGLTMALAVSGLIDFPGAVSLVLGENIGTTITAQLACIGTSISSRRAAMAHTMFNVIGVSYMLVLVYSGVYTRFIDFITPGEINPDTIMRHIANSHTVFNIVNTLVFLPLVGFLEKAVMFIIPGKEESILAEPQYLEKHLLDTPSLALYQAKKEIVRMTEIAKDALSDTREGLIERSAKPLKRVANKEDAIDNLQREITLYLVELSKRPLGQEEADKLPPLLHSVNDIERIGDHAENIVELIERAIEENMPLSDEAVGELKMVYDEVDGMCSDVIAALSDDESRADDALEREKRINKLQEGLRYNHIARLNAGKCKVLSGIIFLDIVNNLEKIGDHLTNVAQAVKGSFHYDNVGKKKHQHVTAPA
ncbi:MAG: hypothetical protein AUJ75_01265 [Candidatus Omnitrophica bacterium CG1_02_49_10]|nr:MAG: hypothetical protein AUJ75_01265 [Candidatus Omnitrophica bacterium CG1_02_49_10]